MAARRHPVLGKTVLITGAARGIGADLAKRLAARGAKIVAVGLEREQLEATARLCSADALAVEADVTDFAAMQDAVAGAVERFGGLDVLVANAGVASFGTLRTIDPEAFDRTVEVNLLGQFRTVRAGLEAVIERRGYVLTVASAAALAHSPGMGAYCASKAGVEAMADALRLEVGHLGVGVGVAYPAWIDTDMVSSGHDQAGFRALVDGLAPPLAKVTPLDDLGAALVDAMECRVRAVAVPGWVRAVRFGRGLVHTRGGECAMCKGAPDVVRASEGEVARRGAAAASMFGRPGETESSRLAREQQAAG